ncbi:MAG: DUF748 domain-containing protein, partial [Roseateles sp.]
LSDGLVVFDDRPVQRRHELSTLHLALPFVSTLPADVAVEVTPRLSGKLDGVSFDGRSEALPFADPPRAHLALRLDGLDLAPLAAYVPASAPLRIVSGRLGVDVALDFAKPAGQAPSLRLSGGLQLRELALNRPDGQPLFGLGRLSLQLEDVQPLRRRLGLGAIVIDTPSAWLPPMPLAPPAGSNPPTSGADWQFSAASVVLKDGRLTARDLVVDDIQLQLGPTQWPMKKAAELDASLRLGQARLSAKARLAPELLEASAVLSDLAVERLAGWLPLPGGAVLTAGVSTQAALRVKQPLADGAADRAELSLHALRIRDLRLSLPGVAKPLLTLAGAQLDQAVLEPGARRLSLGMLALDAPRAQLARDADGRLNLAPLLPAAAAQPQPDAGPAWSLQLAGLAVERGALRWRDGSVAGGLSPVNLVAEPIKLRLGALGWPAKAPVQAQLGLRLAALAEDNQAVAASAGELQWTGRIGLAPLSATGSLQARALPLQLFNAYIDPALGLHLQRAELGLKAELSATQQSAGWLADLSGEARVGPLTLMQTRAIDGRRVLGEELLSWQSLQLDGLKLALAPGAAPKVVLTEAVLDDAYARLIVSEQGHFNLRDIRPAEAKAAAAAPAPAASSGQQPQVAIERIRVNRGLVDFNDRFVRPNYSARLSELQGSLGAFSSASPTMAPLTLRGKVAGTGLLEIDGQLKPGAPLGLDIAANASDIELAPLSPYAAKYAGYAIERGKLSTRLRYKIEADGSLSASNQIILNQLTFGDKVDSPDATTLPVRFAVALLKDRDGVIDVNLPIRGSLNDPEFSVGGIVWKLVLNLIGKALTSPFALFSGSDAAEEAEITFAAGGAELSDSTQLDQVAQRLADKPGVRLTLSGWAHPAAEAVALRERRLATALQAENAASPAEALRRLYQASALPDKPKNLLGMVKELPPEQMRSLLLASYPVDTEALRQLAVARAVAVRDALLARGAPNARVFLAAPKLCDATCGEAWRPHVELTLSAH